MALICKCVLMSSGIRHKFTSSIWEEMIELEKLGLKVSGVNISDGSLLQVLAVESG